MNNTLLTTALKASIPIITVSHPDILNVGSVLSEVLGVPVGLYPLGNDFDPSKATIGKGKLSSFSVFFTINPEFKCNDTLYNWLVENEKTLIIVNGLDPHYAFDAGMLTLTIEHIRKLLKGVLDPITITAILPTLQGLTIKAITELLRLTTAQDGNINASAIVKNRSLVTSGVQGLCKVDNSIPIYFPNKELQDYIDLNKDYFVNPKTPTALVPRGILLNGLAGCGKTLSAKYISQIFDAPLYRLDLSASLSKYVGNSERNLASILSAIEQNPTAIFLIDECEKLFGEGDDSGVTSRLLAQLLWFLQEHKSRTFVVITTNDMTKLPPELYRQGRIDQVLTLSPLTIQESYTLAYKVAEQFSGLDSHKKTLIRGAIDKLQGHSNNFTPATITGAVYSLVKKNKWLTT